MKIFSISTDGGDKSNVKGFWLIEIKSLFSIVILCFEKGSRDAYHSHAFNALTWFIWGDVEERHRCGPTKYWKPSLKPKYTPRSCFHQVYCKKRTFAISFRGPWRQSWNEYSTKTKKTIVLTSGRKVIGED